jgi:hypothetical protein
VIALMILGVVLWFAGGMAALVFHWQMVEEVNGVLPAEQQFEQIGWGPIKSYRLWTEHIRLCPTSSKRAQVVGSSLLAVAGMFATVTTGLFR